MNCVNDTFACEKKVTKEDNTIFLWKVHFNLFYSDIYFTYLLHRILHGSKKKVFLLHGSKKKILHGSKKKVKNIVYLIIRLKLLKYVSVL